MGTWFNGGVSLAVVIARFLLSNKSLLFSFAYGLGFAPLCASPNPPINKMAHLPCCRACVRR
jgi:hypothetical protein